MLKIYLMTLVAMSLSGCYTMLYPPPAEMVYSDESGDSAMALSDSVVYGGVTIYNQNQMNVDSYYQDPYYYRGGYGGGYQYWDPYYYNPYGYHRKRHWWGNGGYGNGYNPPPGLPAPKTPRRQKDYRRSEAPSLPNQTPGEILQAPSENNVAAPVMTTPGKPAETPQPHPAKPEEEKRSLRPTQPPAPEPEKPAEPEPPKDDKQQRREKSRDR